MEIIYEFQLAIVDIFLNIINYFLFKIKKQQQTVKIINTDN